MYACQEPWVDLYETFMEGHKADAYATVLAPWLRNNTEQREWLLELADRTQKSWSCVNDEDLCRLYAASRVTSLLLLRFQNGTFDGSPYRGPEISVAEFVEFHCRLGFRIEHVAEFHPFFHEITDIVQSDVSRAPAKVLSQRWPTIMLNDLLYCRAGCLVEAGIDHVNKSVAERSKLYWAYWRKDRPYEDESHGWGSNSQWRTQFRRDYHRDRMFHYNVDAAVDLDSDDSDINGVDLDQIRELVRNRCLIRHFANDSDLCPYSYRMSEPE